MTLIVTAMIGNYSIMAADKKQTIDPYFSLFQHLVPDTTKIVLHKGIAFTGSGNANILDDIKSHYINLINNEIIKITEDQSSYFNKISDFNGLNFTICAILSSGVFLNIFYLQNSTQYIFKFFRSDHQIENNNFKIGILYPPDIKYDSVFEYSYKEFSKLHNLDKISIIDSLKNIFKKFSTESKFISADFDVVFLEKDKTYFIENIEN